MISIKETVKDPYTALELMCNGLLRQNRRKGFVINMGTYGDCISGICYGCAASSVIQEIAKKNFKGEEIGISGDRAYYLGFSSSELLRFEECIDNARQGFLFDLFKFFGVGRFFDEKFSCKWYLGTDNWKQELPKIRKFIRDGRKL